MKELLLTDGELREIISRPLMERLKKAGFHTGMASDEQCSVFLPVHIDLVGLVTVQRTEDGVWSFRQELSADVADRMAFVEQTHAAAIAGRETPCR